MPWFKADDGLPDHRKVRRAGTPAMGLWVLAGTWSARNLTDGFVPRDVSRRWDPRGLYARSLVDAGLWEEVDSGFYFDVDGSWAIDRGIYRKRISKIIRALVFARDHHACLHCGATDRLTLDHIYPWSRGGSDKASNLQTLCMPCNRRKGVSYAT